MNLPPRVLAAFKKLGDDQRGRPELAMVRAQKTYRGGVLNPVIEHVGDLTHRMTHHLQHGDLDYSTVADKVRKTARWLSSGYGFEREFDENIAANAKHAGVPTSELLSDVREALRAYAEAHRKLVVYNRAQWLAREAAILLGESDWGGSLRCLKMLGDMLSSEDEWERHATAYRLDSSGDSTPYTSLNTKETASMPWTAEDFREKHNKKLTPAQAHKAAKIANAILERTGDEGKAIRVANSRATASIRQSALSACLDAELAAEAQWDSLSTREQHVYAAAHPRSKFARSFASSDSWWTDLSPRQQKAYVRSHPGSKYAKNGGGPKWGASTHDHGSSNDRAGSGPGADFVRIAAEKHGFETHYDRSHTGGNEIGAYSQTGPRVGYPELHAKLSAAGYRLKSHGPNFDDHHYTYERPSETHKYDRVHLYAPEAKPGSIYKIGHSTGTRWSERD